MHLEKKIKAIIFRFYLSSIILFLLIIQMNLLGLKPKDCLRIVIMRNMPTQHIPHAVAPLTYFV